MNTIIELLIILVLLSLLGGGISLATGVVKLVLWIVLAVALVGAVVRVLNRL